MLQPFAPDMLEQPDCCLFSHVQNTVKAAFAAEIGIRHLTFRARRRELQEQPDLAFLARRTQGEQMFQILAVHREDKIKRLDVATRRLTTAQPRKIDAAPRCRRLGARIGRLTEVVGMGTGGVGFDDLLQSLCAHHRAKNTLGRR